MPRTAAALSLLAAMTLTGANVAFGKALVAAFPIYVFVLFRFVISSLALLVVASAEQGPKLRDMSFGQWRDLVLGFTMPSATMTPICVHPLPTCRRRRRPGSARARR